jgi:hypothetical protein
MAARRKYVRRDTQFVVAVQLDLDTTGFTYQKWGDTQTCKRGDWIVNNHGDIYTVDRESFARTYEAREAGTYVKSASVWAEVAPVAGSIPTKEGSTHYDAGDYLVSNDEHGSDTYAVSKSKFEQMYKLSSNL